MKLGANWIQGAVGLAGGVAAAVALAACGAPNVPPPDDPVAEAPAPTTKRVVPSIESEIGALDARKVDAAFSGAAESLKNCYASGVGRIPFLAGDIRLSVRVDENGATKYVFVSESTLGDRTTEACMLGVLKKVKWPKPEGGKEGNAAAPFNFSPGDEERPPVEWSEARMGDGYKKAKGSLAKCRKNAGAGPMTATLYVETDGKALGVGVSGADVKSDAAASCVVDLLMGLKYASPGSYAAKVTVAIE